MDVMLENLGGYELVASGGGRKLERFGDVLIDRPSPQAIWPKAGKKAWGKAVAVFNRGEGGTGDWERRVPSAPEQWSARIGTLDLTLRLTGFGNVGVFPEHFAHFDWMERLIKTRTTPRVLNLFAYTGSASLKCSQFGAQVMHVDAAKSVNGWAIENAKQTGVAKESLRILADDAVKFVKRELRRGNRYDGIIVDPPTFGRGTKGEVWKVERDLFGLMTACKKLLTDEPLFVLLTSHSPGVTPSVLATVLQSQGLRPETGEMLIRGGGPPLPAGTFARWTPNP